MRNPFSVLLLLLLISGLALGMIVLQPVEARKPPEAPSPEKRLESFKWFATLGFPDLKGSRFVRVATGRWYRHENDPPRNTYAHGFLLEETGDTFKVLSLSLETTTFRKTAPKAAEHERVGFEVLDLKKDALLYARRLIDPEKADERDSGLLGDVGLHASSRIFVLAWGCWRQGLDELASELCKQAVKLPKGYGENADQPFAQPLRQVVAEDIAHAEMWRAVLAFGDPGISRAALLERFERLVKHFPESNHRERAREAAELLRQMVKEDTEHAARRQAGKPFNQLSKQEQIAELIFQLRDQNGHQYFQPGACDIFDSLRRKDDTPAHRLVQLGYDAVPQLIEALADRRFTRSVGFHRNFYFSHHVLRVGDCAEAILGRIAGRSFFRGTTTSSEMIKDGAAVKVKAEVQAWWTEFQKKGEKRFLIEAVERGDQDSYNQATRLLKRYPDAALPAILTGIKAAGDRSPRSLLVAVAAEVKGDAPVPFLLAELKEGPDEYSRVIAAQALHERGRPEALAAMLAEWNGRAPRPVPGAEKDPKQKGEPVQAGFCVAEFLFGCGRVEGIKAVGKDLKKRSVEMRLMIVEDLAGRDEDSPFRWRTKAGNAKRYKPEALRAAAEELLIAALDDVGQRFGQSGSRGGKSYSDPRICDFAGHALNQRAPEKYPFDLSASLAQRNRSLVELKNVWRKAHGQSALPLPERKAIPAVADKELRPLLDSFLRTSGAEQRKVERDIERLGLGALPGVLKRRDEIEKKDSPARLHLEKLACRIACLVTDVEIDNSSVQADAVVLAPFRALKGKPFDPGDFILGFRPLLKQLPKGAEGVRYLVNRDGETGGITLKVVLLDEERARSGRSGSISDPKARKGDLLGWHYSERVTAGGKTLRSSFGIGTWDEKDFTDLGNVLQTACSTPVDQLIEVHLQFVSERAK